MPQIQNDRSAPSQITLKEELSRFAKIQERLSPIFREIFPDREAPRSVIIIPSASLDHAVL